MLTSAILSPLSGMLLQQEENQVASKLKRKYHQIRSLWGKTAK